MSVSLPSTMIDGALLALLAAVIVGWLAGVAAAGRRARRVLCLVSWLLAICAALMVIVVAASGLRSGRVVAALAGPVALGGLRLDRLSDLFLLISFGVGLPALASSAGRGRIDRPRLGAACALVMLCLLIAVTGSNLFTLLLGWEGLGLAFYLVVGHDWRREGRGSAAVMAAGFSSFSGAAILLGGAMLYAHSGTPDLAGIAAGAGPAARAGAFVLFLGGFGVKIGLAPLHVWLPRSYAAAPGPARAILAGSAVNVGFYGLWRALELLGAPPVWLACLVLVIGSLSAILGISHATVNADLAQLIAWSSVENAGVILVGYGVALVGTISHHPGMVAAGLVAATAQVIAHALGKSLLFVSAAAIEDAYGTTDLDEVRGVARRLPFSGAGLVIGALTMAGVPLTAGFASEWLTLEALMQQFRTDDLPLNLSLAFAGVLIALTIGIAGVAFVRLIALTAFGPKVPRLDADSRRHERSAGQRIAICLLCLGCLGVSAAAPLEIRLIAAGLGGLTDQAHDAVTGTWILQPVYADFSALSPSWLWIVILAYTLLIAVVVRALTHRRMTEVRRVEPWTSASPGVAGGHGYTSFGYANPMRKVLAAVLLTRGGLTRIESSTGGVVGGEERGPGAVQLGYTIDVVDIVERFLYRPFLQVGRVLVAAVRRLQSGRLDAYLLYMLVAVIAVLAATAAFVS